MGLPRHAILQSRGLKTPLTLHIDAHFLDRTVDIVSEGFDMVIRVLRTYADSLERPPVPDGRPEQPA